MEKIICGMQQIGIGIPDVHQAFDWYRKAFGCDIKILDAPGTAERMLPYTGGKPQDRHAILAINLRGGGGFEIWQPLHRELRWIEQPVELGDYGIEIGKVRCADCARAMSHLKAFDGAKILSDIVTNPVGVKHFYIQDRYNNIFDIEEDGYTFVDDQSYSTGGALGAVIGVSDMDKSLKFYADLIGYDRVVFDKTDVFADFASLLGGGKTIRRVVIEPTTSLRGPLSEVMGTSRLELVQVVDGSPVKKIYANRWWGDPGFIHLCFDVRNMEAVRKDAERIGHPFVCDSGADFQMGEADGHFTYVEDPDGTLIEFVETFKIPILKKLGIYLHLKGKDPKKPLPRIVTKALRFLRVK